jgi:hypothetical protein
MKSVVLFAALWLAAGGCYLKPTRTNNPLQSCEGVRVTLVGQDCEDHAGGDGDPVSRELGIKVRFDNPTDQVLRIAESRIRLVVGEDAAGVKWADVEEVAPRSARTVAMDFTHHATCDSSRDFTIAWNDALALGDRPIAMTALIFSP